MTKKILITSGDYIKDQYLKPMKISAYRLAKEIGVSSTLVGKLLSGKTSISPDVAYRLGVFFDTGTKYWLDLQALCDSQYIEEKYSIKPIEIISYKNFIKNTKKKLA
jgi:addiction module HigA family antidote